MDGYGVMRGVGLRDEGQAPTRGTGYSVQTKGRDGRSHCRFCTFLVGAVLAHSGLPQHDV